MRKKEPYIKSEIFLLALGGLNCFFTCFKVIKDLFNMLANICLDYTVYNLVI